MVIIGCDFHPSGQQVYGIERESGEVVAEGWIAHSGKEVDQFYAALPAGAVVGVESSGNLLWFERKLAQYGHRLRIGDAAQIQAHEVRKQKHDRRSAELIARLLWEGRFPDLRWVPSLAERDLRQLLLHRDKLVRMRTQVKNQLQHIAMNQGQQKKRQLWSQGGRALLEKLPLEPWTARRRDDLLRWLDQLDQECASLDEAVEQAAAANAEAGRLRTHPGIGPVISLAFVLTIGPITRFQRSRELVSYLGLNPSEQSSGERRRLGGISQTRQRVSAALADSRSANGGARRCRISAPISTPGGQETSGRGQGDGGAEAGGTPVLDAEDAADVSRTGSYAG